MGNKCNSTSLASTTFITSTSTPDHTLLKVHQPTPLMIIDQSFNQLFLHHISLRSTLFLVQSHPIPSMDHTNPQILPDKQKKNQIDHHFHRKDDVFEGPSPRHTCVKADQSLEYHQFSHTMTVTHRIRVAACYCPCPHGALCSPRQNRPIFTGTVCTSFRVCPITHTTPRRFPLKSSNQMGSERD